MIFIKKFLICLVILLAAVVFYNSQNYTIKYIYPSPIKSYEISSIGMLDICCSGTWNKHIYAEPYDFNICFTSKKEVRSFFIKNFSIYYDDILYELEIEKNNMIREKNRYYISYKFFKKKSGDKFRRLHLAPDSGIKKHIQYKITLCIDDHEHNISIPAEIICKTMTNNKLLLPFQQ